MKYLLYNQSISFFLFYEGNRHDVKLNGLDEKKKKSDFLN